MISLCNLTSKLKNGIRANKKYIYLPSSSLSLELLRLLFLEGIILGVTKIKSGKTTILKVFLKYNSNGSPSFKDIKVLSKPGKMFYLSYKQIAKLSKGVGLFIISTKEGLLTNHLCLKRKIGGAALCYLS
jgi:small subunit ribosomal protein S8